MRNLIDNALAHTPRGTAVQITVAADPPTIEVCDNGPLHGPPGSGKAAGLGLGHQVVGRVALVHNGHFDILPAADGSSTCYKLTLGRID